MEMTEGFIFAGSTGRRFSTSPVSFASILDGVQGSERISGEIEKALADILALWRQSREPAQDEEAFSKLSGGMKRLMGVFIEFLRSPRTVESFGRGGATHALVEEVAGYQHQLGRDAVGVIEDFAVLRRLIWRTVEERVDLSGLDGGVVAGFFVKLMQASDWVTETALEAFDALVQREMDEALGRAAATDLLTGLPDRDLFGRLLLPRTIEAHEKLSLAIFDIAAFSEAVAAGEVGQARDAVRRLAETVQKAVPGETICARFGDDEICALLPGESGEGAYRVAEDILRALWEEDPEGFQVDVGVAEYPLHARNAEGLVTEALKALKIAKRVGGSGIVVAR